MATKQKRLTFVITKEMEPLLKRAKKNLFYDRNQSDMIRELVITGLEVVNEKSAASKNECELAP